MKKVWREIRERYVLLALETYPVSRVSLQTIRRISFCLQAEREEMDRAVERAGTGKRKNEASSNSNPAGLESQLITKIPGRGRKLIRSVFIALAIAHWLTAQAPALVNTDRDHPAVAVAGIQDNDSGMRQAEAVTSNVCGDFHSLADTLDFIKTQMAFNRLHYLRAKSTGPVSNSFTLSIRYEPERFDETIFEWKLDERSEHLDDGDTAESNWRIIESESSFRVRANVSDINPRSVRIEERGSWIPNIPVHSCKVMIETYGGKKTITFRQLSHSTRWVSRDGQETTETSNEEEVSAINSNSVAILFADKTSAERFTRALACAVRLSQQAK